MDLGLIVRSRERRQFSSAFLQKAQIQTFASEFGLKLQTVWSI